MPQALLAASLVVWLVSAIKPVNLKAWALESVLMFVGLGWLIFTFGRWRLSNFSYGLIFIYLVMHVIGAHFTYSQVPGGSLIGRLFGTGRNSYDRLVHFLFGFLLFDPWRETVVLSMGVTAAQASLIAILIIGTISAVYEILEWLTAKAVSPPDAMAFIGAQGDFFDAEKDMACALLGALLALGLLALVG